MLCFVHSFQPRAKMLWNYDGMKFLYCFTFAAEVTIRRLDVSMKSSGAAPFAPGRGGVMLANN